MGDLEVLDMTWWAYFGLFRTTLYWILLLVVCTLFNCFLFDLHLDIFFKAAYYDFCTWLKHDWGTFISPIWLYSHLTYYPLLEASLSLIAYSFIAPQDFSIANDSLTPSGNLVIVGEYLYCGWWFLVVDCVCLRYLCEMFYSC